MNKTLTMLVLFLFVSAKPIEKPKTIILDTEKLQRHNEKYGTWENNIFVINEDDTLKQKKIIFDEDNDFLFPLENKKINDRFGINKNRYHLGVDYEAKYGEMILASKYGEVIEIGYNKNLGSYLIIEYPQHIKFTYAHLSKIYVRHGDYVEIGQIIGRVGVSGNSTGPHLHLEITYQNVYMNHNLIFD